MPSIKISKSGEIGSRSWEYTLSDSTRVLGKAYATLLDNHFLLKYEYFDFKFEFGIEDKKDFKKADERLKSMAANGLVY